MIEQYKNNLFIDIKHLKKKQNRNQPYFQGILYNIKTLSNKLNKNKSGQNKIRTISIFSDNNSLQKNKKYKSPDNLKIYSDISSNNNQKLFRRNFNTIQGRPISLKKRHQNFLNIQKRKKGGGIRYNSGLCYPQINLNSTNSNINSSPPFHIRRNNLYEKDNVLADEYEKLRKIWKELGVTDIYINNFQTVINNHNNSNEEILQSIKNEEKQMTKFKEELIKLVSEIIKREKDIKNIKELNKKYLNIKTLINISPQRNIKNIKYMKQKEEINNIKNDNNDTENDKIKDLLEEKMKIEEEIKRCLIYIRLHGINVVAGVKKFSMRYEHLFNAGKIDINFLKSKFGFDRNYLMKLKNDLDFLKDTDIGDIYHFSQKGEDPFLISLSINKQEENKDNETGKNKYKILPISEDMIQQIKIYNHMLNEAEIFTMMRNELNKEVSFSNYFSHSYKYVGFSNGKSKNNDSSYILDSRFKTINNTNISSKITFNNIKSKHIFQNNKLIKFGTQNDLENLKKNLEGPYFSKVDNDKNNYFNTRTIQMPKIINYKSDSTVEEESSQNPGEEIVNEVENRVNKDLVNILLDTEKRVKKKVEEKLKIEQERIEEKEKIFQEEKEKFEELRRIEEEKIQKDKEKWEKMEQEEINREEKERKKFEDDEKLKKEENDKFKKDIEQKLMIVLEERFKKEENNRKKRKEEIDSKKMELELKIKKELEEERQIREKEENEKGQIKEKITIEEIEKIKKNLKKDENDKIRREEINKLDEERKERMKLYELDRKRKEDKERIRKEIDKLKGENEDRIKKDKDEKKKLDEEYRNRKEREDELYKEINRLEKQEIIKMNFEKEYEYGKKKVQKDKNKSLNKSKENSEEKNHVKNKKSNKINDRNYNLNSIKSSSRSSYPPPKKNKKRQVKKGISSEEEENINKIKTEKNEHQNNRYGEMKENEIPSSSNHELRLVDIRNLKGSKLEVDVSDIQSLKKSRLEYTHNKKNFKLTSSYNNFNFFNSKKKLRFSTISQKNTMKNKVSKKEPMKGIDEVLNIKDYKIIFKSPKKFQKTKKIIKLKIKRINRIK